MDASKNKLEKLSLERLVFFSDAVVAIAITLLALDLKIDRAVNQPHFTFYDIASEWRKFIAFLLSFILIALFWIIHHQFFHVIQKIDESMIWQNIGWLFFIVLLPFSTTLISSDFGQTPSVFVYSLNILGITIFQNTIWDYAAEHPGFLFKGIDSSWVNDQRVYCNVAMANALLAAVVSFFNPTIAFLILFTRPAMKNLADRWLIKNKTKRAR